MILSLFGLLVDPTDCYTSKAHKNFSICFVWIITNIVGSITPLAFIAVSILALCLVVPLPSVILSPLSLLQLLNNYRGVAVPLGIWAGLEIWWYFYCWKLKQKFEATRFFPGLSTQERQCLFGKVLEHCRDPLQALIGWFYKHTPQNVGSECMEEWLSWAYFSKDRQTLNLAEDVELDKLFGMVVSKYPEIGRPSNLQANYRQKFMKHNFDEMVVQHKPFIAYVVISLIQMGGSACLKWQGFQHHSLPGNTTLSYWSYYPTSPKVQTPRSRFDTTNPDQRPIFIVYGIGLGVVMYVSVIKSILEKDPSRPVFILELPHISMKIVHSVPTMAETIEAIDEIFRRHKIQQGSSISWMGHSFGTIVTGWILKERPAYVTKVCFVDPVCFALWEPDLVYNFLYRQPIEPMRRLCQFFVAQDLLISYALFRNFWWFQNVLFPEDIKCPARVFVSSHDYIIDANGTYSYLKRQAEFKEIEGVKSGEGREFNVVKMHGLAHGSFLNSSKYTAEIVSCL